MKKLMIATALVCAPVMAVQADATTFNLLDADKNNSISKTEAEGFPELVTMFEQLDTNSDGELSVEEFSVVTVEK